MMAGILCAALSQASQIEWEVRSNTMSDEDVRIDGRCLYAYTPSATRCIVNGMEFGRFTSGGSSVAADIDFGDSNFSRHDNFFSDSIAWTGSSGYEMLLKNAWYCSNGYQAKTYTIVFKGLEAGKRHLIQFWVCDARGGRSGHTATIGSASGSKEGDNGIGVNFTGTFIAGSSEETIELKFNNEAIINAMQVRCLDDAKISWSSYTTSGAGDVRTCGTRVYAYKAKNDLTVNGVLFKEGTDATAWGDDIELSSKAGWPYDGYCATDPSVPDGAYSYSDDYRHLTSCGFYTSYTSYLRRIITLKKLEPGLRYLVQIWNFDNRNGAYSERSVLYDNDITVSNCVDGVKYGHGSYVVGTFVAASEKQTISYYARCLSAMSNGEDMFGAIQVRCLDKAADEFTAGNTAADGSLTLRGKPLYAYAARETDIEGTMFRAFRAIGDQYGDLVFTLNGEARTRLDRAEDAFLNGASVAVVPAVSNLLAGALYRDDGEAENEVHLRRLVPGRRYLVQAWFADTRPNGYSKYVNFGGATAGYLNDTTAPLGQYVTGVFRATNATHAIMMNKANMQINAIQVRELDIGIDASSRWTIENTLEGEASVSTEGTTVYAYAPVGFRLDNGVEFTARSASATDWDGVTLNQPFGAVHNAFGDNGASGAMSTLLNNGWYQGSGSSADYEITLHRLQPGHEYIVQLFVADLRGSSSAGRRISIYGNSGRYGNYNDNAAPFGTTCTGRFTANCDTYAFQVNYDGIGAAQLNAIQVRDLGPKHYLRNGAASQSWKQDGEGWTDSGIGQDGKILWSEGNENVASIEGDAEIGLAEDIWAKTIIGTGNITIGETGCGKTLNVASEVTAPSATINAIWGSMHAEKTMPGKTTLRGTMPLLKFVNVWNGNLTIDNVPARELQITVMAPGELGFDEFRQIDISSITGDGAFSGPGGIDLADGKELALPSSLNYKDGFAWRLSNGSTILLPKGTDAAKIAVRIDNPREYKERAAVKAEGNVSGKPMFIFPEQTWTARWDDNLSGWKTGYSIFMMNIR